MTKFKPGDTIRSKGSSWEADVIAVYGDRVWAIREGTTGAYNGPLTYEEDEFDLAPDFFEEGKTYARRGVTFEVEAVRHAEDRGPIAFGRTSYPGGEIYEIRTMLSWDGANQWKEVT
jgi:hypothetical protein